MSIIRYIPAVLSNLGVGNATRFKNRIINGDMRIDQRNAGASVTPTDNQYTLDRWYFSSSQTSKLTTQQNAGSVTTPIGFVNYLGITSTSAYSINSTDYFGVSQKIEGLNIADLGWGTANAKTVTLSFQVYSSLTGTFGGSLRNNGTTRSYPFTYSISVANTWTQISVTVAGDTSGTWLTTNGNGMQVNFSLGTGTTYSGTAGSWSANNYASATGAVSVVGTSGATFYITGVQLEVGNTNSSFDYVDYTSELAMCQRYYQAFYARSLFANNSYIGQLFQTYVSMRTSPTITFTDLAGTANKVTIQGTSNYTISAGGVGGGTVNYQTYVNVDAIISGSPSVTSWWAIYSYLSAEL